MALASVIAISVYSVFTAIQLFPVMGFVAVSAVGWHRALAPDVFGKTQKQTFYPQNDNPESAR